MEAKTDPIGQLVSMFEFQEWYILMGHVSQAYISSPYVKFYVLSSVYGVVMFEFFLGPVGYFEE